MSLAIYPNFPVTSNHKWRIRHASIPSDHNHQKKTQTCWSSSSNPIIATRSIKLIAKSCTLLNKSRNFVTTVAATTTPRETTLELKKKRKGWFWFRKWDSEDVANMCWFTAIHVLAACAPFVFDWGAFWLAVGLIFLTGMGVTLGYHRLLCHRSFKIPKWLEYLFVYCGAHAFQKDPMFYVNTHKSHHKYADTERDPVTPTYGFWYCNMGWFCNNDHIATKCGESRGGEYSKVPELKSQWFYRFLHDTYFWHPTALAALLYLHGGFPYLAWGVGMRGVVVHQFASLASYVSHIWGERPWNTPDTSTNNWWVAILTLGEGWHNNHHAFPTSARHGFEWWQFDMTWELIKFLELVGLATEVKLPTETDKRRISLRWANSKQRTDDKVEPKKWNLQGL